MKIIRIFIIFCFIIISGRIIAQPSTRISDTIPYEIKGGKIILSVGIGGKPTKFILDTGGVNLLTSDSANYHGVKILMQQAVADVNSKNSSFYKGSLNDIQLSTNIKLPIMETLVTPPQAYFRDLGVAGALGGEAFKDVCVTFIPKEKLIILTYPYRPAGISRKDGLPMSLGNSYSSIFPLKIGNVEIPTLFDTGMSDLLHLTIEEYNKLKNSSHIKVIAEGTGIWHVGVGGISGVNYETVKRFTLPEITIANKVLTDVDILSHNSGSAIIGIDLLKYGQVILDYPRGLFYFYPFEAEPESIKDIYKVWNINILPIKDHFEVTATIGDVDLELGEWVWNINGTDLDNLPLDQGLIIDLLGKIETPEAYLLVGKTKNNMRKVIIKKI